MSKLYSTAPSGEHTNNKSYQKMIWAPQEELEQGKAIILITLVILFIGILVLHISILLLIALVVIGILVTRFIVVDAQTRAFEKYWDYWQSRQ